MSPSCLYKTQPEKVLAQVCHTRVVNAQGETNTPISNSLKGGPRAVYDNIYISNVILIRFLDIEVKPRLILCVVIFKTVTSNDM